MGSYQNLALLVSDCDQGGTTYSFEALLWYVLEPDLIT